MVFIGIMEIRGTPFAVRLCGTPLRNVAEQRTRARDFGARTPFARTSPGKVCCLQVAGVCQVLPCVMAVYACA